MLIDYVDGDGERRQTSQFAVEVDGCIIYFQNGTMCATLANCEPDSVNFNHYITDVNPAFKVVEFSRDTGRYGA